MATDDELIARDVIAIKELQVSISDLNKSIKQMPDFFKKNNQDILDYLEKYSSVIASLKDQNYSGLSNDDKLAIDGMQRLLARLNFRLQVALKRESSKHTDNQDQSYIANLKRTLDQLVTASARDKAYADQTRDKNVKMPDRIRNIFGIGSGKLGSYKVDDTATQESEQRAKDYRDQYAGVSKSFSQMAKEFVKSFKIKPAKVTRMETPDENFDSKQGLSTFDYLYKGFALFGDAIVRFNGAIVGFTAALGSAFSSIMSGFADLLTGDPISGVVGMIQGMSTMMTSAMNFVSSMLDSFASIFSSLLEPAKHNDTDSAGGLLKILGSIVTIILSIISSIISVAMQAIQSAFQMFTTTLQAIFKIVKKIASTSPIIKAILELLNLAFTLFFMPFMNSFALVLLPYVIDLLDWTITNGQKYTELGAELGETFKELITADDGILESVKSLATTFIEDFAPDFKQIMTGEDGRSGLLGFAQAFTSVLIDNKQNIIDFLDKGLDAFKAMVDAGFLDTFLQFGSDVMEWMSKNATNIVSVTSAILNGLLKVSEFFIGLVGGEEDTTPASTENANSGYNSSVMSEGDQSLIAKQSYTNANTKNDAGVNYFRPENVTAQNAGDAVSTKWSDSTVRRKAREFGVSEDYIRNMNYEQYVALVNGMAVNDLPWRQTTTTEIDGSVSPIDINDLLDQVATAAQGGKFAFTGGIPVIAGEGGQGEYKLSESELEEIGKDTTVAVHINGTILSKLDFKEAVRRSVTDISTKSYYR